MAKYRYGRRRYGSGYRRVSRRRLAVPTAMVAGLAARTVGQVARNGLRRVGTSIARRFGRYATKRTAAAAGLGAAGAGYGGYRYSRGKKRRTDVSRFASSSAGQHDVLQSLRIVKRIGYGTPVPRRLLLTNYIKRSLRWQSINVMNSVNAAVAVPGGQPLVHRTQGTSTICPMNLFCLNSTNNQGTTTGPAYYLQVDDNGTLTFGGQSSQASNGGIGGNSWQLDGETPNLNAPNTPATRYIMQGHYDIRLNCYGCNSQPTLYSIMVVSFNNPHLDPLENPSNAQEASDRQRLWQAMVQRFMSNPILPVQYVSKKYKVHASASFVIQPTLNIENDITPSSKIVNIVLKDGQFYDYMYHGDGFTGAGADDKLSTVQWVNQGTASSDYSDLPQARARKWLIVRAMNTTRTAQASENGTNTPSYDIIIRKNEYFMSNNA